MERLSISCSQQPTNPSLSGLAPPERTKLGQLARMALRLGQMLGLVRRGLERLSGRRERASGRQVVELAEILLERLDCCS